jgi:hypothetical protein
MLLWRGVSTRLVLTVIVVTVMGVWTPALAQVPIAQMSAVSIHEGTLPIVLDGDLSDPAWQQATPITAFVQREPLEGAPGTMRTEARVAFDATIPIPLASWASSPGAMPSRRRIGFTS